MNAQGTQSFQQIGSGIRLLYESKILFALKNFPHLSGATPCRNDEGQRGMKRADFSRKLITAAVGKAKIEDDGVDPTGHQCKLVHRLRGGACRINLEAPV